MNKLIFIEGPDGVGKSSILEAVYNALDVETTQEPFSGSIRDLATSRHADVTTQTLLYCADRHLHMREIREWLAEQDVICDRGPLSTLVYQGLAGGGDLDRIEQLNDLAMSEVIVDATVILHAPFDVICQRIADRDDEPLTPTEQLGLHQIWCEYEAIRLNPDRWRHLWLGKLHFIDANRPAEEVEADAIALITRIIKGEA